MKLKKIFYIFVFIGFSGGLFAQDSIEAIDSIDAIDKGKDRVF